MKQRVEVLIVTGIVSLWFASSSISCIYSEARVAMTIGDRHPAVFEQVALWSSITLQPWIIVAMMLEPIAGTYFLTTSLIGCLVASVLSALLIFLILAHFARRSLRATMIAMVSLAFLAAIDTYIFVSDMRSLPSRYSHSGP